MAVHMGRLVVSGLFGPCKINVYKKKEGSTILRYTRELKNKGLITYNSLVGKTTGIYS